MKDASNDFIKLQGFSPKGMWIKFSQVFPFAFKGNLFTMLILITAVGILFLFGGDYTLFFDHLNQEVSSNNTGTIINIITLLFIIFLWGANVSRQWRDSLERFLSVQFKFEDNTLPELGSKKPTVLISESDIRALAQQIGQQNNNNNRLSLDSSKYESVKTLCFDSSGELSKSAFWHYQITVALTRAPSKKEYKSEKEYLSSIENEFKNLREMQTNTSLATTGKEIEDALTNLGEVMKKVINENN